MPSDSRLTPRKHLGSIIDQRIGSLETVPGILQPRTYKRIIYRRSSGRGYVMAQTIFTAKLPEIDRGPCAAIVPQSASWALTSLLMIVWGLIATPAKADATLPIPNGSPPQFQIAQVRMGRVCVTKVGSCPIPPRPVNTQCFCGNVPGVTR